MGKKSKQTEIRQASAPAHGRPVKHPLPDAIPNTPEGVANAENGDFDPIREKKRP